MRNRVLRRIVPAVLCLSLLIGPVSVMDPCNCTAAGQREKAANRVIKGLVPSDIYRDGRYIYYVSFYGGMGTLHRYDLKKKKQKKIHGDDGGYGYELLVIRGKYIYAFWRNDNTGKIYRMSKNGKNRTLIQDGVYSFDALSGSRIYYREATQEWNSDFEEYYAGKGAKYSIKLDGTDQQSAKGIKIKRSKQSAVSGSRKIKVRNYTYIVSKKKRILKRGNKILFKCKKYDEISFVSAHKKTVVVGKWGWKDGIIRGYYMDINGNHMQYIGKLGVAA